MNRGRAGLWGGAGSFEPQAETLRIKLNKTKTRVCLHRIWAPIPLIALGLIICRPGMAGNPGNNRLLSRVHIWYYGR